MPTEADGKAAGKNRARVPTPLNNTLNRDRPLRGKTWRDHLVDHLRVAASVEHALMVQYLFAAYSLNPEDEANKAERSIIVGWQNLLLSVAKEEMGHLLTVQNALCLLGAPAELMRDYQIPDHNYTMGFKLEPLTLESVRRYGWAEMADKKPTKKGVVTGDSFTLLWGAFLKSVRSLPKPPPGTRHVGALYRDIIEIISDPALIPDSAFREDSFDYQASWDDWGRGYSTRTPRQDDDAATALKAVEELKDHPRRADVIVDRMATRTQLKAALTRIFEQGEAAWKLSSDSHFYRFATIHDELKSIIKEKEKAGKTDWRPTYQVAENPHTVPSTAKSSLSLITWSRSKQWADLFDLRYGLLLSYLIHTFKLARNERDARLRGAVVHRVFGEMYNLKAIAGILVKLPLRDPADPQRAGPPFSIPESLKLPSDPTERWETHRCQLKKAQLLTGELNAALSDSTGTPEQETAYLQSLRSQDKDAVEWIDKVIAGLQAKGVVAP